MKQDGRSRVNGFDLTDAKTGFAEPAKVQKTMKRKSFVVNIFAVMALCGLVWTMAACGGGKQAGGEAADEEPQTEEVTEEPAAPQLSETNPADVMCMLLDCHVAGDYEGVVKYLKSTGNSAKQEAALLAYGTQQQGGLQSYEILSTDINGDQAVVCYQLHFGNGHSEKGQFTLVQKEDGTWKVWK